MRENRLRRLWGEGEAALNGWLQIADTFAAETMAHQGWDALTIDMQHGAIDYHAALSMLQAISTTDVVPMARVPWLDPGIIMKMLDAGAYGIICPMVNDREQTEALVSACRYPPDGSRSFGPIRGFLYGGPDYVAHANATVLAIAMIETRAALDNLDEILSTPGLDAVYVGPSDLSMALGEPPRQDITEGPVAEAIDAILAAAGRHGVVAGLHNQSADYARGAVARGFRLVTIGSDVRLMAAGAKSTVDAFRAG